MLKHIRQFVIPVLILGAGAGGYWLLSKWKQPPDRVAPPSQAPLVETQTVAAHTDPLPIRFNGVVVPFREVRIAAEVDGRIVEKADGLRSGRFVAKGSPLLTIDPEPYELELEKLTHEARQASLELRRVTLEIEQTATLITLAEQRLELVTSELARLDELKEKNVASQAARDIAALAALKTRDELATLQSRRDQLPLQRSGLRAKSALIKSRQKGAALDLTRTKIAAPLDAIVTADPQEIGSFVERGDHLLTLQDPSRFEVECRLRKEDLFWLQESAADPTEADAQKAAFELPEVEATVTYESAGETFTWQGRLERADGSGFDATTRTLACRVVVDEPRRDEGSGPPTLIAGMFVDVQIEVTPRTELLALPRGALQPDGQVWVVSGGKLAVHRVRPVRVTQSTVLLRADRTELLPGSRVVVSDLPIAFDGMDVRERPAP